MLHYSQYSKNGIHTFVCQPKIMHFQEKECETTIFFMQKYNSLKVLIYICNKRIQFSLRANTSQHHTDMTNLSISKATTLIYTICICIPLHAQHRHALLVGLSRYASDSGWTNIHGTNDIKLLKQALPSDTKIEVLTDANATYANITRRLQQITERVKSNDIVYLHFSGHGQPFEDLNGDEEDGWDESFVPYDARQYYEEGIYEGERHLVDDTLNKYLMRIRAKAGSKGMVYVVIDACHSGGEYRNDEEVSADSVYEGNFQDIAEYERGVNVGFSKDKIYAAPKDNRTHYYVDSSEGMSPIVVLEACLPDQKNCEIKRNGIYCGALSYSVATVLRNRTLSRNKEWVREAEKTMREILPKWNTQKMVVEESK